MYELCDKIIKSLSEFHANIPLEARKARKLD
jgi:hypothetical protein